MKRWFVGFLALMSCAFLMPIPAQSRTAQPASPPNGTAPAVSAPVPADSKPGAAGMAQPPRIPAASFASHNQFTMVRMSPDGAHIALVVKKDGKTILGVIDTVTGKSIANSAMGEKLELEWYRWAGSGRLLYSVSQIQSVEGEDTKVTRLFVLDVASGKNYPVGPRRMTADGDNLVWVSDDGATMLLNGRKSYYDYPSVYRISLGESNDDGKVVQSPRSGVWDWFADDSGVVRLGLAYVGSKVRVYYRKNADDSYHMIAKIGEDDEDKLWNVRRIVEGSDEGYVIDKDDDGRVTLQLVDYSTRKKIKTIYRNPDWDVDDVAFNRKGEPIAVYYTDDHDRIVWLDKHLAGLQKKLEAALTEEEIWIGSHAENNSRALVFAGGAADPGGVYLFDAATKSVKVLFENRPGLDPRQLVSPRPISYTARDGTVIHAYLTLPRGRVAKALPLILLPHGGPYGIRDKLRYDDEVQFLANRGYAVLQPNYRGSGGYGESFEKLGDGQIGRRMQDDLDDAMDWAVKQGIADPARVCVVGSSYGGYAAMWAVIRNPERYRCAASFAGVSDWNKQLRYDADYFTRKGARSWRNRVKGEDTKFDLDDVSPAEQGERLTRPLLLAHGKDDTNVPFNQFKRMEKAVRKAQAPVEELVFDDEGHGFSKSENEQKWYETLEAFLKHYNPVQ